MYVCPLLVDVFRVVYNKHCISPVFVVVLKHRYTLPHARTRAHACTHTHTLLTTSTIMQIDIYRTCMQIVHALLTQVHTYICTHTLRISHHTYLHSCKITKTCLLNFYAIHAYSHNIIHSLTVLTTMHTHTPTHTPHTDLLSPLIRNKLTSSQRSYKLWAGKLNYQKSHDIVHCTSITCILYNLVCGVYALVF